MAKLDVATFVYGSVMDARYYGAASRLLQLEKGIRVRVYVNGTRDGDKAGTYNISVTDRADLDREYLSREEANQYLEQLDGLLVSSNLSEQLFDDDAYEIGDMNTRWRIEGRYDIEYQIKDMVQGKTLKAQFTDLNAAYEILQILHQYETTGKFNGHNVADITIESGSSSALPKSNEASPDDTNV